MSKKLIGFLLLHLSIITVYNISNPLTSQYNLDINIPIYSTGLFLAATALGQFIFAPFWGHLSDIMGRKIAIIGPLGFGIVQLFYGYFNDTLPLVILRFFSGAFMIISLSVHYAYLYDHAKENERTKYFLIASLLIPIGISLGYFIGGLFYSIINIKEIYLIQAGLSFYLTFILYLYILDLDFNYSKIKKIQWNVIYEDITILNTHAHEGVKYLLSLTFLNIVSYQLVTSQIAAILTRGFDKDPSYIGIFIATTNLLAGLLSFIIDIKYFKKDVNDFKLFPYLSLTSIIASLIILTILITNNPSSLWIGLVTITIINTIFIALSQDIITKLDDEQDKGALLGANQAIQSLGVFFGTICAGLILVKSLYASLILGSIMYLITFIFNRYIFKGKVKQYLNKD